MIWFIDFILTHSKNLRSHIHFWNPKTNLAGQYSPFIRHIHRNTLSIKYTSYLLTSLEGQQVCKRDQLKITWLGNNVKHGGKITWRARPSLPRLPDCLVQLPGQDQDGRACLIAGIAQITWWTAPFQMSISPPPPGCSHVTEAATEARL